MKKFILFFTAALLLLAACKSSSKKEEKTAAVDTRARDSADIRNIVLSFYSWYTMNYEKMMKYDLYSGVKTDDTPPYKINWEEAKKYQQFIHDSIPQLGNAFQQNLENLLHKADSAFKVDVADDVPYYFDYDWYLNTQEDPAYMFNEMKNSQQWIISVNGDLANVEIKGYDENGKRPLATVISLQMKKEEGLWKISRIGDM